MAKKNPYYDASKPHHTEFGFQNIEPVVHHPQDLKRWREERKRQSLPAASAGLPAVRYRLVATS